MGPGAFWREIVNRATLEQFAEEFVPDVTFETSSCNRVVRGPADMRTLLLAMGSLYTSLAFISETDTRVGTYLEWAGIASGGEVAGVTVVEWGSSLRISAVRLHQRPLFAVVRFAAKLAGQNLPGFSAADFEC